MLGVLRTGQLLKRAEIKWGSKSVLLRKEDSGTACCKVAVISNSANSNEVRY
jgi:hypothetical protein